MNPKKIILNVLKWIAIIVFGAAAILALILLAHTDFSSPADLKVSIGNYIARAGVPGISIAMVKGDQVVATLQSGYADVENGKPVTDETLFQIGSTSKTVTGTAVMQLYERGLFGLDDNINRYLPFKVVHPQHPQTAITFRQLLTHTAGAKDNWPVYDAFYTIPTGGGDSDVSLEEFVKGYFVEGGQWYDPQKNFTDSAPGEKHQYSNTGYALLAYLVERLSGLSFPEYCKANIFTPLEMEHTTWLLADTELERLAVPYDGKNRLPYYSYATYPDGALKTSPSEYAHLLIAMSHAGQYKGKSILKPETVAEMLAPAGGSGKQALTWYYSVLDEMLLTAIDNGHIIGHTGGDPGICTVAAFNPQNQTGLVLFMNQTAKIDFNILNSSLLVKRLVYEAGLLP